VTLQALPPAHGREEDKKADKKYAINVSSII